MSLKHFVTSGDLSGFPNRLFLRAKTPVGFHSNPNSSKDLTVQFPQATTVTGYDPATVLAMLAVCLYVGAAIDVIIKPSKFLTTNSPVPRFHYHPNPAVPN